MAGLEDDPVLGIFLLKSSVKVPQPLLCFELDSPHVFKFPDYSRAAMVNAWESRDDDPTYAKALDELHFTFQFRPDVIPTVAEVDNLVFKAHFFLYSFIAWQRNPTMKHFPILLTCLFKLIGSKFERYALRAIEHCFRLFFTRTQIEDFRFVFPIFVKFFNNYSSHAMQMQVMLVQFLCALQMGNSERKMETSPEISQYLVFLTEFAERNSNLFNEKVASDILYGLTAEVTRLDEVALKLFGELAAIASETTVISLAMLVPMPLTQLVRDCDVVMSLGDGKQSFHSVLEARKWPPSFPEMSMNIQTTFSFPTVETFKDGIDIQKGLNFSDEPLVSSLLDAGLFRKLELIGSALKRSKMAQDAIVSWLGQTLKEMEQQDSIWWLEIVVILVAFYRMWDNEQLSMRFWKILERTAIFDERVSFITRDSELELIDRFRALIFDSLARDGFTELVPVITSFVKKPSLMAEVFHRIMGVFPRISKEVLGQPNLIRIVSSITVYFRDVHFRAEKDHPELVELIELTRSSIFLFLNHVVEDPDLVMTWFSHQVFATTLFCSLFERSTRSYILLMLKSYLVNSTTLNLGIVEQLKSIINIACSRIPDLSYVDLLCDLMQTLNEQLTHQKDRINLFGDLNVNICSSMKRLIHDDQKLCERFLVQAIHFFAVTNSCFPLQTQQLDIVKYAVYLVDGDEPSDQIFAKFIQLIAGAQLSSITPSFIIGKPTALASFVSIYWKSKNLLNVLSFLRELIGYSFGNSIQASSVGFDAYLLGVVNEHKNDDFLSKEAIGMMFQVVSHIACIVGSNQVVQRFLQLFYPENGVVSKYHTFFMKQMAEMISATMRAPEAWLPLNSHSAYMKVTNIHAKDLPSDFTIVFWVFIDQPASQGHLHIFEMLDQKGTGISVFICSGTLLIVVRSKTIESTARCEIGLPVRQWTPVMIRVKILAEKTIIIPVIDHCACRRLDFKWTGFKDGPLSVFLGLSQESEPDAVPPVLLASFALYAREVNPDDVTSFSEAGSVPEMILQLSPKYLIYTFDDEGDLGVKSEGNCQAELVTNGQPLQCYRPFCGVLVSNTKPEVFLALFSMFDMITDKEDTRREVAELAIDLLNATLQFSDSAKRCFAESNGFEVINALLTSSKSFQMQYSTYVRFYSLLESFSELELQRSLIENILANFSVLGTSDTSTQERILKHWLRNLMSGYQTIFQEVVTIRSLLALLQEKYEEPEYSGVRSVIMSIIKNMAHEKVDLDDWNCLLSSILSAKDEYTKELIDLLIAIVMLDEGTLQELGDNLTRVIVLETLMTRDDETIFRAYMCLFMAVHRRHMIPDLPCYLHSELIIRQLRPRLVTRGILDFLTAELNRHSIDLAGLMPLCCFIAMNLGEADTSDFFGAVIPHKLDMCARFWVIALASRSPNDIRTKILRFVLACPENDWKKIAFVIEIVCADDEVTYCKMMHEFVSLISQIILEKKDMDLNVYSTYFHLASVTICYQKRTRSEQMEKAFNTSVFWDANKPPSPENATKTSNDWHFCLRSRSVAGMLDSEIRQDPGHYSLTTDISEPDLTPMTEYNSFKDESHLNTSRTRPRVLSQYKPCSMLDLVDLCEEEDIPQLQYDSNWLDRIVVKFRDMRKERVFSIRTDRNGDWLDKDIAALTIQLFEKVMDPLFINYDLLFCAYLLKYKPLEVIQHLKRLKWNATQVRTHQNYFHLICKYIEDLNFRSKIDDPSIPKTCDRQRAFAAFTALGLKREDVFEKLALKGFNTYLGRWNNRPSTTEIRKSAPEIEEMTRELRETIFTEENTRREVKMRRFSNLWTTLNTLSDDKKRDPSSR